MGGRLAARLAGDLKAAGVIFLDADVPPAAGPTAPIDPSFRRLLDRLPVTDGLYPPWHEWWPVDVFEGYSRHVPPNCRAPYPPRVKLRAAV